MTSAPHPANGGGHPDDPSSVMEEVTRQMQDWLREKLAEGEDGAALGALIDQGVSRAAEMTATVAGVSLTVPELLDLLSQQTALFDTVGPLRLADGPTPAGVLVNSWRAAVHRQTRAAMALVRQGLEQEALANTRSALEHAALLAVADRARRAGRLADFLAAVEAGGQDQAERHLKILKSLDEASGGQHQAALDDALRVLVDDQRPAARKRLWDGEPSTLFKTLPDGGFAAYSFYKVCSENTHAGAGSAMAYLAPTAIGGPIIRTPIPLHVAEMLAMLTWCLVQADATMDGFIAEPLLQARHMALLPTS